MGHRRANDVCCYCGQSLDDGRPCRTIQSGLAFGTFRRVHRACHKACLERFQAENAARWPDRPEVKR